MKLTSSGGSLLYLDAEDRAMVFAALQAQAAEKRKSANRGVDGSFRTTRAYRRAARLEEIAKFVDEQR